MNAVVVGVGMVPFRRYRDRPVEDYGRDAVIAALDDAGLGLADVDTILCGARDVGLGPGSRVVATIAPSVAPIVNIEAASATGGVVFREAVVHLAAGAADVVLAMGVGKRGVPVGHLGGSEPEARARARAIGLLPAAGQWAMELQRRQLQNDKAMEACVAIAVKAHHNGSLNPNAHRFRPVTAEEVRSAPMVCSPLTNYHCCPASDGAAAIVLASQEYARKLHGDRPRIEVAATTFETHPLQHDRRAKSRRTAQQAYEQAGLGPADVDIVSAYDSFSIEELVQVEDLGFAPDGGAEDFVLSGATALDGSIPFNTDGGNLSRGHAIGPTGLAQLHEIVLQLRGEAGARQVPKARVGLVHHLGASGEALTNILCAA